MRYYEKHGNECDLTLNKKCYINKGGKPRWVTYFQINENECDLTDATQIRDPQRHRTILMQKCNFSQKKCYINFKVVGNVKFNFVRPEVKKSGELPPAFGIFSKDKPH